MCCTSCQKYGTTVMGPRPIFLSDDSANTSGRGQNKEERLILLSFVGTK